MIQYQLPRVQVDRRQLELIGVGLIACISIYYLFKPTRSISSTEDWEPWEEALRTDPPGFQVSRTGAMAEHDPHILSYSHLREFPREKEALHSLKKIASLVKPLMRARGWKVNELAEFYPDQANLLGLNQNKTLKILLRLRYPGDKTQFMPLEQVVDTMLHELAHIVHGPHDEKFHALWNKLREEYEALIRKGYTGERFLSEGHRLGGSSRRLPIHEARRLARAAAEQRKRSGGSGQRLGGAAPRPGEDIRRVIVDAVERRNRALKGCGNTNHSEREIRNISDQATRNGFKTKAEEDAANETAIAQALWELVQEDEKQKFGSSYVEPSAQNPAGDMFPDGDKSQNQTSLTKGESSKSSSSSGPPPVPAATRPNQRPTASAENEPLTWTCQICTLVNKADFLCCAACENERSTEVSVELSKKDGKRPNTREVVDLTGSSPVRKRTKEEKKTATGGSNRPSNSAASSTWTCSFCGRKMDSQWWTCATCARLKDSS